SRPPVLPLRKPSQLMLRASARSSARRSLLPMSSYNLGAFALLCLSSLLAIINPLTTAPLYLSITDGHTDQERLRALRTAITTGICVLVAFALLGGAIFKMFGITIHAFRIEIGR